MQLESRNNTSRVCALVCTNLRRPLAVAALFSLGSVAALAQTQNGVTGTIKDSTGAAIPHATVVIINNGTKQSTTVQSSDVGSYAATGLVPGRYTITTTAPGFSKTVSNDVNVEVSTQQTIDITLANGASDATVEVTAPLIGINTTTPELGTTIENEVVLALPTEVSGGRGRQIDNFIFLAPGVQGSTFSHRVNGGVDFQTETLFNGIPVTQAETAGYQTNFNPPFELVSQFRVERATFSAQYGLAQGATTYQMASGTNSIHGDVFEYNRNNFFDAKGYFNDVTPTDKENNYGGTVGGPIFLPHLYDGRNKTFFHTSIERTTQAQSNTNIGTVPTALEKTGDFSDFTDRNGKVIPIFDPTTGQQFVGNRIPTFRFSPLAQSLLASIPDPDRPGLQSNKSAVPNSLPNKNFVWGFTVDHNLTQSQSLHYTMWRNAYSSAGFDYNPIVPATNILQSEKTYPTNGSVYLLNYSNTLAPTLVMTAGIGWIGEINNQFNAKRGVNFAGVAASPLDGVFPNIKFDGTNAPTNYGTDSGWVQSINRKLGISIVNNFLWTKGRHTLNIGGEFRRAYQDDNECQSCAGQFNFSQKTTADPKNLGSTGSSFASFLLGQVDNANRTFANELALRNLSVSPYVQDDIKVSSKLTANIGLRYDILLPFTEKNNQIVYLNPTQPNPAAGNLLGAATKFGTCAACSDRYRADVYYGHIAPRIGFSYAFNEKTVIQGGYSLAFLYGGSYEFGTSKVAVSYGNLLQGSFTRNSTNTNVPGYGSWDANILPAPPSVPFNSGLGIGTTIRAFNPQTSGHAPYVQQYSFNVQRQLPFNSFLQVAYVGNHDVHLNGQLNPYNQPDPSILRYGSLLGKNINDPGVVAAGFKSPYPNFSNDFGSSATLAQSLAPFPQYSNVYNNYDLTGAAIYNSLQFSLEKRFSNGLAFLTSYTLSKTLSNVDSGFSTFAALPENKFNQYPEFTVASNDIRHNTKVSGTYDLPIGPGKSFANNKGLVGQLIGGFQVGFILSYYSGTPFGISENDNPLGTANQHNRPNVTGAPISTTGYHFNGRTPSTTPSFTTNAFASNSGTYTLGNAYRNYNNLRNPAQYNENLNARKKFAIGEHVTLLLQMDYFNAFNRTIFNGPGTNVDNSDYGLLSAGQSNTPRQGQVSGKIIF